jgi:hypothetical protein
VGTIWSAIGPRGVIQVACALAACCGATIGALLWAHRWPNRVQAIRYAVLSNASIALAALARSEPNSALLASMAFATLAAGVSNSIMSLSP